MATGVPAKVGFSRKRAPVYLYYEGKETEENILSYNGPSFENILSINGGNDNILFYGDNQDALSYMLNNDYKGKIKLVYIDPPFATSFNFINRELEHAYCDGLCGGEYVEFLRKRLIMIRELLSIDGSIYLHLDSKMAFKMKVIMDEVFGEENCRAFITRKKCSTKNYTKNTYGNISDYIMFYTKSSTYTWNRPYDPWEESRMKEEYRYIDEVTGKRYKKVPVHAPGVRNGETGKEWRGSIHLKSWMNWILPERSIGVPQEILDVRSFVIQIRVFRFKIFGLIIEILLIRRKKLLDIPQRRIMKC